MELFVVDLVEPTVQVEVLIGTNSFSLVNSLVQNVFNKKRISCCISLKSKNFSSYLMAILQIYFSNFYYFLFQSFEKLFTVPDCNNCGGIIQPDIVFFGGSIPKERHAYVERIVDDCDSLLVLGTSLSVFSSYRILLRAHERNMSIAIVNIGSTRGEQFASIKINGRCGEILPLVC